MLRRSRRDLLEQASRKSLLCCATKLESSTKMNNYLKIAVGARSIRKNAQFALLVRRDLNNEFCLESS